MRHPTITFRAVPVTLLLGVALLGAAASPASAAAPSHPAPGLTADGTRPAGGHGTQRAAVPSCVRVSTWSSGLNRYAQATNHCSTTQWVKIKWAFARDTACTRLVPKGGTVKSSRKSPARYDGIVSC